MLWAAYRRHSLVGGHGVGLVDLFEFLVLGGDDFPDLSRVPSQLPEPLANPGASDVGNASFLPKNISKKENSRRMEKVKMFQKHPKAMQRW
jgi:hypothetical protein